MYKNLTITAVLGALAVILGAFGAHALKEKLTPEAMQSFETAIRYQFFHVLVLLLVNMFDGFSSKQKRNLTLIFVLGILFFSGSIYVIYLLQIPAKTIWFITPLGGLLFVLGWIFMTFNFFKMIRKKIN